MAAKFIYGRTGRVVCSKCKRGYGSEHDGLCCKCRGCTAWEAINGKGK